MIALNLPPTQIAPLQAELYSLISTGTTKKVELFLKEHPELLNEPLATGSPPLHTAIRLRRKEIARAIIDMRADPIIKDSRNLDALEHAYIAGENALATTILKKISKTTPSISFKIAILNQIVVQIRHLFAAENSLLPKIAVEAFIKQRDIPDEINQVPLEKAMRQQSTEKFVLLFVAGANLQVQSSEGQSLLHLALSQEQLDIAHLLLIAGLNPNEKDSSQQTLLTLAAKKGNLDAVYLLLAYGAKLDAPTKNLVQQLATAKDPLQITNSDYCYFTSTIAYWLCRGCISLYPTNTYLDSLPTAIHLLGCAWAFYQHLPIAHTVTLLSLEMLPATNIAIHAWKASTVALSAFFGIRSAWESSSEEPRRALQKGVVHAVNTLQSLHTLQTCIATEYASSQQIQALVNCINITTDDIARYESMPPETRMEQIVLHSNTASCPPLLELAFPSWSCDSFKKLYREEVFKHHPDKNKDGSSTIQIVLNAAKSLWSTRCEK